ncbi:hypothetical protein FGO68_gene16044 [Halteria grandinella]|uniref:THIF-type NAD/FAD binding fold domain-containing protein n=1 Tax=Halteria grandinella TaxID=5974 RepID=A0A8J8T351_HALGN|nr:hypothetical protein FGO68_gene16044 [Halteria grandinella]
MERPSRRKQFLDITSRQFTITKIKMEPTFTGKSLEQKIAALTISGDPQDPFDRQKRILGWNQSKLQSEVCLLLGAGGLGTSVAMGLARLGVGKLILLDKDCVEVSNLNRQVLFNWEDVGKPKVLQAEAKIRREHHTNKDMIIEAYNMCALENWQKIVELSAQVTVIFNMIDVGDYFDAAVQSLCMARNIPLIQGGTFCQQITIDLFRQEHACFLCCSDTIKNESVERLLPSKILSESDLLWLPKNKNPIGQSNCYLCVMCSMMMVARYSSLLINDPDVELNGRFIMTVNSGESFQFNLENTDTCAFCRDKYGPLPPKEEVITEAVPEEAVAQETVVSEQAVATDETKVESQDISQVEAASEQKE